MNYYAGYDIPNTDIAVFKTKKERDEWVSNESIMHRIAFSENEAMQLADGSRRIHKDPYENNLGWIFNFNNI